MIETLYPKNALHKYKAQVNKEQKPEQVRFISQLKIYENHKRPENFFPARAALQIEDGLLETVTPSWKEIQR